MPEIRLVDLRAQYDTIRAEIDAAVAQIIESTSFVLGEPVEAFERAFATYCEATHAVGCASGTDALYLALRAMGVGPTDEVITVPNTFIGTTEAITLTGARPVFVDVQQPSGLLDPGALDAAIGARTAALLPVHLQGHLVRMDAVVEVAERHGLPILEDAAQAHGARFLGRSAGSFGRAAAFSFYPGKNLGAYGDGGAIVTSSDELAHDVRMLRNHGRVDKYLHEVEGINSRLDALQAAILSVKLTHLDRWNHQRRRHAALYCDLLADVPDLGLPPLPSADEAEPVWHLFVIRTPRRDAVGRALREAGIASGIHYPVPLHLQPAYQNLGYEPGDFPVAEHLAETSLSLPMYPELTADQIERVAQIVRKAAR